MSFQTSILNGHFTKLVFLRHNPLAYMTFNNKFCGLKCIIGRFQFSLCGIYSKVNRTDSIYSSYLNFLWNQIRWLNKTFKTNAKSFLCFDGPCKSRMQNNSDILGPTVTSGTSKPWSFHILILVCFVFLSLVHFMLEEVVNSAVNRCISTELMEPSVSTELDSITMKHCVLKNLNRVS